MVLYIGYLYSGFAFVLMDDPRDAEDAVRALDGSRICGRRVKVGIKPVFNLNIKNNKDIQDSGENFTDYPTLQKLALPHYKSTRVFITKMNSIFHLQNYPILQLSLR